MKIFNNKVSGNKGDAPPEPHVPIEEENTLQSNTTARLVDLLCEGEISGPAINDDWYQSTFFNETPVRTESDDNFTGVTIKARRGTADQSYLRGYETIESEMNVNQQVTKNGGAIIKSISDTDVDDVRVTLKIPTLMKQEDDGDLVASTVKYEITVTPDNGAGAESSVGIDPSTSGVVEGKCISEFRKQHLIQDIKQYGSAPWVIKVYRRTDDSSTVKLQNDLYWYSYTTIKNVKLQYRDRAVVGVTINSKDFGDNIPYRAYKVKGRKVSYPSNYNPSTRSYTGTWNGSFVTGYTNNPAWILYDLLVNKRFGVGLEDTQVDKWSLYTIAVYCDEQVSYIEAVRGADGKYTESTLYEPRFTFNGVIASRGEALSVVNHLCSVFRGFPIWSTGQVNFVQDTPRDVSRIASPANVVDGVFEYSGVPRQLRHTAAKVSWNNPELFGRLDVLTVEDQDGIEKYGWNPIDITCFGCTSKSEAIRRARYILYTDINQTEAVTFAGGMEWADCLPGEIISVQDPNYADVILSGRVISGTTGSIKIDKEIEIEDGVTYTLRVQTRWYDESETTYKDVKEVILTNSSGTTDVLTWSGIFDEAPLTDAVWIISSSSIGTREFLVMRIAEVEGTKYEIGGVLYNSNKYAVVEDGIVIDVPPTSDLEGELDPPSNIELQPYSYTETDQAIRKYGLIISWTPSPDARANSYDLRYKRDSGGWIALDGTSQITYDWRDIQEGTYDISVRARGITGKSVWVTYSGFVMITALGIPDPVTNLQVAGGGTIFSGQDCHIEWTGSAGASYDDGDIGGGSEVGDSNVKNYKIEVYKIDDTLLRTAFTDGFSITEFIYTYEMNKEDNSGTPIRDLKFKVYTNDFTDTLSPSTTLVVENPVPSMASATPVVTPKYGYLKIEWTAVSDNDMDYYKVYSDTNNSPSTLIATIAHPNTIAEVHGIDYGTDYYVKVVPYDKFGEGIASNIPSPISPLEVPSINVNVELTQSITMSDSNGNNAATLAKLYDKNFSSLGVDYVLSGTDKWIQYAYEIENYFDRVGIWTSNAEAKVYIGYSDDGTSWTYLKAKADHTLTSGELTQATNLADAKANYWQMAIGKNIALFPNNVVAKYVRVFMTGTWNSTFFEVVPSRIIISELAAIENLSAISADIGTIIAGNLQTSNYTNGVGMNIDLDAKRIYLGGYGSPTLYYDDATDTLNIQARVTFRSGSSGIANTDAGELATKDEADWATDVSGAGKPEDFATNNTDWEHPEDQTTIDGGSINVGSFLQLREGGKAVFGDQNVIIDTEGDHGSIVVSEDGGPTEHSFCELSDGDINFQYWNGSEHLQYKSLTRMEAGVASNGVVTNIPGIFRAPPFVMVSPNAMDTYLRNYTTQSQKIKFGVDNLIEYATGQWQFTPTASLQLSSGTTGGITVITSSTANDAQDLVSPSVDLPANTRSFSATVKLTCYEHSNGIRYCATQSGWGKDSVCTSYAYRYNLYKTKGILYLQYYSNGAWHNGANTATLRNVYSGFNQTLSVPLKNNDITKYRWYWDFTGLETYVSVTGGNVTATQTTVLQNQSYSSDQVAASVLANGSLNWLAIGS